MADSRPGLQIGLRIAHVLQAAVFAAVAWELWHRWKVDAGIIGVAAVLQLAGVLRRPRLDGWLHLGTVVAVAIVYGRFGAVALHVERVFGPMTGQQTMGIFGGLAAALPWVLFFPLARLIQAPPGRAALLAPLALLPILEGLRPYPARAAGVDAVQLADSAWTAWRAGEGWTAPEGTTVRLTPFRAGVPKAPATGAKGTAALGGSPGEKDALLLDVAVQELPYGFVRPGTDGPANGGSPHIVTRSLKRVEVLPGFSVPALATSLRWRSVLVSDAGAVELERGWSKGPEISPAAIDAAVRAASAHLLHNMKENGEFTYIVRGPSGEGTRSYNYPRHAGTTWFLARAAVALGDAELRAAADRALAHLESVSTVTTDGRAYVLDPDRKDGKSWVGTTALGLMAAATLSGERPLSPVEAGWLAQVAASVDETGKVRGEMRVSDQTHPDQTANAYGQGQAMLALAIAERNGHREGSAALDRAIHYVESGGYHGSAHPLAVADEHWMCLVARAVRETRGIDAGAGVCDAYVATERYSAPPAGAGLVPAIGPAAGGTEAVVARAWDTRDPALIASAVAWGQAFLNAQYRPADAPLLAGAANLVGGYRDGPGELDVQIDSVQHTSCALLGIEALISGRARPGSLP